ncbi:hypothetical protein MC885_001891 [Smutsia gigantea]|nr:hypothetical protein MC885_001891 [Smutsia gigantea]
MQQTRVKDPKNLVDATCLGEGWQGGQARQKTSPAQSSQTDGCAVAGVRRGGKWQPRIRTRKLPRTTGFTICQDYKGLRCSGFNGSEGGKETGSDNRRPRGEGPGLREPDAHSPSSHSCPLQYIKAVAMPALFFPRSAPRPEETGSSGDTVGNGVGVTTEDSAEPAGSSRWVVRLPAAPSAAMAAVSTATTLPKRPLRPGRSRNSRGTSPRLAIGFRVTAERAFTRKRGSVACG